jgi:hypothetical protein
MSGQRSLEEWVEILQQERGRTERRHLKRVPGAIEDQLEGYPS